MAQTSRLTIIAELRDNLTAPLRKVKKAVDDLKSSTDSYAFHASRQGQIFNRLTKEAGYYVDAAGRWRDENHRFVGASKITELRFQAQASAAERLTHRYQRAGDAAAQFTARVTRGADGVERARLRVYNLSRTLGVSAQTSTQWAHRVGSAYARLPQSAGTAVSATIRQMDRLAKHNDVVRERLGRAYKWGGIAAGVVAGFSMNAGMERINQLQGADVRLEVMGHDDAARQDMLDMVNEKVVGTFVTLGEGATMLTQQLGAGVSEADIGDRMQAIIDAASMYAPNDVARVSMIMSQIQAKGRLTGEEALQLGELGAPVYDWVAQDLGVEKSEVSDLISTGEYTAEEFFNAMSGPIADGAKKMGETFIGAWMTMKAAFARAAEDFLTPMLEPLENVMRAMTQFLDNAEPYWLALGDAIGTGIQALVAELPAFIDKLKPLGAAILTVFQTFGDILPELVAGFGNFAQIAGVFLLVMAKISSAVLYLAEGALPVLIPALLILFHLMSGVGMVGAFITAMWYLGSAAVTAATGIWGLLTKIPVLGSALKAVATELKNAGSLGRVLMMPLMAVWTRIVKVGYWLDDALTGIGRALRRLRVTIFGVNGLWRSLAIQVLTFWNITRMGGGVLGRLIARLGQLWGWFSKLSVVTRIAGFLAGLWATATTGAGVMAALRAALMGLLTALRAVPIVGWIVTGVLAAIWVFRNWGNIIGWVQEKWAALFDGLRWQWATLKAGAQRAAEDFIAPFRNAWDWLMGLGETLRGWADGAWDGFVSGVSGAWDWVLGLGDAISQFVDDALARLQDLAAGFTAGPLGQAAQWITGLFGGEEEPRGGPPRAPRTMPDFASPAADQRGAYMAGGDAMGRASANVTGAVIGTGGPLLRSVGPGGPSAAGGPSAEVLRTELFEHGVSLNQIAQMSERHVGLVDQVEWAEKGVYWEAFNAVLANNGPLSDEQMYRVLNAARGTEGTAAEGFFTGGYTGNYGTHEIAGLVHGQEFVLNANATRSLQATSPGAAEYINTHGALPPADAAPQVAFTPTVNITVGSTAQAQDVAAAVRAELERQSREMSRRYMTPALRGAH